ncbi:MAG: ribonuclease HII [Porphyromonas sp.]|nr:ribonuclease HII [Porphyromonas sp.]
MRAGETSDMLPWLEKERIEAGCDEAGRGALAGPVVAASVVWLPENPHLFKLLSQLNDSKQLSGKQREQLFDQICSCSDAYAISEIDPDTIDRINIYKASCLAMSRAADALALTPDHLLIDGNRFVPFTTIPYTCLVKGDARFASIASASILAKVYRDRLMQKSHELYPEYGFNKHVGYPTPFHKAMIKEKGLSPIHRKSYKPCMQELPFLSD